MAEILQAFFSPFHSLCEYFVGVSGMEIDKVRYFLFWLISMPLGFLMYYGLPPSRTSPTVRHIYSTSLGVVMGLLCFGWEMLIVLVSVLISYGMLVLCSPARVQRYMMVYIIATIASAHVYRMIVDYGGYTLDFTGPLMVLVQKFSGTAFSLHDGMWKKASELSEDQRKHKIIEVPSLLSYLSYCFNFLQFLTGPSCTYSEYNAFVQGTNLLVDNPNKFAQASLHSKGPSTIIPWLSSLMAGLVAMAIYMNCNLPALMETYIKTGSDMNVLNRILFCHFVAVVARCRYYMAWKISESISNAAGLGFSGYDEKGNAKWETSKNCDPLSFEFGTNPRAVIGSWNITTNAWLRRVCYTQVPYWPTLMTFGLSALWHGFYPSYYMFMVALALLVEAARKARSLFRPYFLGSPTLKMFYDVLSCVVTHLFISPGGLCFMYLDVSDSIKTYTHFYFLPIIIPVLFLLLPIKLPHKSSASNDHSSKKKEESATRSGQPSKAKEY